MDENKYTDSFDSEDLDEEKVELAGEDNIVDPTYHGGNVGGGLSYNPYNLRMQHNDSYDFNQPMSRNNFGKYYSPFVRNKDSEYQSSSDVEDDNMKRNQTKVPNREEKEDTGASGSDNTNDNSNTNTSADEKKNDVDTNSSKKDIPKEKREHYRSSVRDKERGNRTVVKKNLFARILIACISSSFLSLLFYIVIIMGSLSALGIIDLDSDSNSGSNSSTTIGNSGFSSVSNNASYWWPVGGTDDVNIDNGTPSSTTITSSFGDQESFRNSGHGGVDIGNAGNGPGVINVIAAQDGKVIYPTSKSQTTFSDNGNLQSQDGGGYGNYVMIQHDNGVITVYAHLSKNSITVISGDTVKQGQVIGKMGNSGRTDGGTHLHFEVRDNGIKSYPLNYINNQDTRPIKKNYINAETVKESVCLNLKNMGIPDNGVAAIMTNIYNESSFRPTAHGDKVNEVYTSYGLCQWHNERRDELMNSFPNSYDSVSSQLEFLMYELNNKSQYNETYISVMDANKSVYDSTYTFCYNFEIPDKRETRCKQRAEDSSGFAEYVYNGCK